MSTINRKNQKTIRQSLETLLKNQSPSPHISYFEFLVIAKQFNLRFESHEALNELKTYFQKGNGRLDKNIFLSLIEFKGCYIVNNTKTQLISVRETSQTEKDHILSDGQTKYIKNLVKKIGYLKTFFQNNYGKKPDKWFEIFNIEGKKAIHFNQIKWTLKMFMNNYISDNEIRLIYQSLQKDSAGAIHPHQFEYLFDLDYLKSKLEGTLKIPHRVETQPSLDSKSRAYPMMIVNSPNTTIDVHRPSTQQLSTPHRKNIFHLKYFKKKNQRYTQTKHSIQSSDRKNQMLQTCHSKIYQKFSTTDLSFSPPHNKTLFHHLPIPKRRSTKATILRKRFIDEQILPRQRKLQQQRFKTVGVTDMCSQVFGRSIFL